ncbi:hypothetical protein ZHAS_00007321 [Anopheles sinensis]|uniref:Uncharacterized protein n=1 Tax=Anopheles sinensis TaxID=74873 RepID=A0A084VPP5_ANOSI|nr:hypothetical protein ZHAS_00007321 [Anopheles sinensis]
MAEQRNRATSELLNGSSEEEYSYDSLPDADQSRSPQWNEWPVKLEETSRLKQHRIIVPSSNQFEHVFNEHQERPLADEGTPAPAHDLTNDIAINFRLATDRSVTVNPFAITFDPTAKPSVVVQRDPFPGAGSFPGPNGRPSMGFPPQQQPGGGGAFPMAGGSFPGFPAPGGQFPVQPFPMQPPLFTVPGVGPTPNFGFPQNPQAPPFFFGNGQFGRP